MIYSKRVKCDTVCQKIWVQEISNVLRGNNHIIIDSFTINSVQGNTSIFLYSFMAFPLLMHLFNKCGTNLPTIYHYNFEC